MENNSAWCLKCKSDNYRSVCEREWEAQYSFCLTNMFVKTYGECV